MDSECTTYASTPNEIITSPVPEDTSFWDIREGTLFRFEFGEVVYIKSGYVAVHLGTGKAYETNGSKKVRPIPKGEIVSLRVTL